MNQSKKYLKTSTLTSIKVMKKMSSISILAYKQTLKTLRLMSSSLRSKVIRLSSSSILLLSKSLLKPSIEKELDAT